MPTRPFAPRRSLALAAAAAALAAGNADADVDTGREILHTGQTIPGLGRVGELIANPLGVDSTGRVVVMVYLDDGSRAIARTDGGRLMAIWRHDAGGDADTPDIASAVVSPDGTRVAALGGPQVADAATFTERVLYDLSSGLAQPLLTAGDQTADGATVLGLSYLSAISDAGAVLAAARIAAPETETTTGADAVLLRDAEGTHVIASANAGTDAALPFQFVQPVGLTATGAAVFLGCVPEGGCSIWRSEHGTLTPIVSVGDPGPDGVPITNASALSTASNGEVLAEITQADGTHLLVRSEQGQLIRIRGASDPLPDGRSILSVGGHLNARGDVTLPFFAYDAQTPSPLNTVVAFYPPDGALQVLPDGSTGGALNDVGQFAVRVVHAGEPARVARWQNGGLQTVLTTRSATGDGASATAAGIRGGCLDDEGRVATFVDSVDATQGWACIDANGPHQMSETPRGSASPYPQLFTCAFAGDGTMVGLANGVVTRIGAKNQIVTLVGERLPDGRTVEEIRDVDVNDHGTLVVAVNTGEDQVAWRQAPGGTFDPVDFHRPGGEEAHYVTDVGIADNDTIVAAVTLDTRGMALVATDDTSSRVLLDEQSAGSPIYLDRLVVRGTTAVASLFQVDGRERHFRFDLTAGSVDEILEPDTLSDPRTYAYVLDLASNGDILYQTILPEDLFSPPSDTWRWRDGTSELLFHSNPGNDPTAQPFRLNASGDLLRFAAGNGARYSLSLSGEPARAACLGQAPAPSASDSGGCQIAPAGTSAWWPLLFALGLGWARRRRAQPTGATGTS